MWLGLMGSTATAISLSGFQSWLYSVVLQLMSTAAAGLPALVQRNRSICSTENCPPGSVVPPPVPRSRSSGSGPHFIAINSAVLNGRSLATDVPLNAATSSPATAGTMMPRRIRPPVLAAPRTAMPSPMGIPSRPRPLQGQGRQPWVADRQQRSTMRSATPPRPSD
jgi:hypothetical protein